MTSAPSSPSKLPRRWYRLHIVSWLVMVLVAAFMGLWNAAGYYREGDTGDDQEFRQYWAYGWPATFLRRAIELEYDTNPLGIMVRADDSLTWRLWERAGHFQPGYLSLNILTAVGICLVCGVATEVWRRRRRHLLQIYLGELIFLMFLIAVAMGVGRFMIVDAREQEEEISKIIGLQADEPYGERFDSYHGTPESVWNLLPGHSFKAGDQLRELKLWQGDLTAQEAKLLVRHPSLRSAALYQVHFEPGSLRTLTSLPGLEKLNLNGCEISTEELKSLTNCRALRVLHLSGATIARKSLSGISQVRTLEELHVNGYGLVNIGLESLADLPHLRHLDLAWKHFSFNADLRYIDKLQHLQSLRIAEVELSKADVDSLSRLTYLRVLHLDNCGFQEERDAGRLIGNLPALKELQMDVPDAHQALMQSIARLPSLEKLTLTRSISDDDAASLSQVSTLRTLKFGGTVSDSGLEKFAALDGLESLDIESSTLTDQSVGSFVRMKGLRHLAVHSEHEFSPAARQQLKTQRPELEIDFGFPFPLR